uniref:Uncharacterized protein n=1 Tax=Plectus sambesii TaxID=2011161 RepID=A0A914XLK3_9BILA
MQLRRFLLQLDANGIRQCAGGGRAWAPAFGEGVVCATVAVERVVWSAEALASGDGTGNVHAHVGTGDMGIEFATLRARNGVVERGFCLGFRASESAAGEPTARRRDTTRKP